MAGLAYDFGFSSCSLTMAARQASGLKSTYLKSDLAEEFHDSYRNDDLIDCDPFLLFSCNGLAAKRIDSSNLSSFPGASIQHQAFLDHVAAAGASNGFGIPVRPAGDDIFGGWLFSSGEGSADFERLVDDHGREAHLAAVLAYERMVALGLAGPKPSNILSPREGECLLWLCAGLRVSMIADKLLISESAVNLYVANAKRKLGAKTREQAIARAIVCGEISL
jgi:DNA-binding CsgD family transcriptional regulator